MKTSKKAIQEVTRLPRTIPFLGVCLRRQRGHVEVFTKTAPRRVWQLQLRCPIAKLPTTLPRS